MSFKAATILAALICAAYRAGVHATELLHRNRQLRVANEAQAKYITAIHAAQQKDCRKESPWR